VNDIIEKILPTIENVVAGIVTSRDDRHELQQELILKCYANEGKLRRLYYVESRLSGWLFMVAKNTHRDKQKKVRERSIQGKDLIDLLEDEQDFKDIKDKVKPTKEMLSVLSNVERMWIDLWIECEFSYLEIQRRTKISRQHAKKRIQEILEKWKQLDIYLPQSL